MEELLLPDVKNAGKLSAKEVKYREGKAILEKLSDQDHVTLLDEAGKQMDSRSFAAQIDKHFMDLRRPMVFVTGGAFGFDEAVYARADKRLSLSQMTFSHHLVRLIFAEQLYRALTIINGHPYHND